ncbi:MAG: hypothetical protein CMH54_07980 [Myxococcales bacterium]|nr:hypothetical protein [Myxococcales bacterium]
MTRNFTLRKLFIPMSVLFLPAMAQYANAGGSIRGPAVPVVNINTASAETLQWLPGIGPTIANRVVIYRSRRSFKSPNQLRRVRGIGRKKFRRIAPHIVISGQSTIKGRIRYRSKK